MSRELKWIEARQLNLRLSDQIVERMEQLKEETGACTLADMVSRSLALYDFVCAKSKSGAKLLIQDTEGTREVLIV